MSTCRQAIAARRKARVDPRFKRLKSGDAVINKHRLEAKLKREKERMGRKAFKK